MTTRRSVTLTETELEALCERAAGRVLMKLGCPDPDTDPAGAARWSADAQMGIQAVTAARENVAKWLGRALLFVLAVGTAWLSMRAAGVVDSNWLNHSPKQ